MATTSMETATGRVTVPGVTPEKVYALVSDITRTGEWSPENTGGRWLGRASGAEVGARFVGHNRRGWARWSTLCRVTDAEPGRRFAFEVGFLGVPISRWQYDLGRDGDGTTVSLTWTDRRSGVRGSFVKLGGRVLLGVNRDAALLGRHVERSLENLRDALTRQAQA